METLKLFIEGSIKSSENILEVYCGNYRGGLNVIDIIKLLLRDLDFESEVVWFTDYEFKTRFNSNLSLLLEAIIYTCSNTIIGSDNISTRVIIVMSELLNVIYLTETNNKNLDYGENDIFQLKINKALCEYDKNDITGSFRHWAQKYLNINFKLMFIREEFYAKDTKIEMFNQVRNCIFAQIYPKECYNMGWALKTPEGPLIDLISSNETLRVVGIIGQGKTFVMRQACCKFFYAHNIVASELGESQERLRNIYESDCKLIGFDDVDLWACTNGRIIYDVLEQLTKLLDRECKLYRSNGVVTAFSTSSEFNLPPSLRRRVQHWLRLPLKTD